MYKRQPETKFEILPYEEVFTYESKCFVVDVHSNKKTIMNWLKVRTEAVEDNSDIDLELSITPEGFYMTFHPHQDDNYLLHMRINHVVALQIKQACEYYIKCYEEHRLQNDITIYKSKIFV